MSYTSLLINTCTIRELVQGPGVDTYGKPAVSWNDTTDVRCRWSTPSNREIKVGAEVVIADLQLFLGDVDNITAQDRVVLDGLTYEILSAADRQDGEGSHHVECLLRCVK